jgi:hypothetical protein
MEEPGSSASDFLEPFRVARKSAPGQTFNDPLEAGVSVETCGHKILVMTSPPAKHPKRARRAVRPNHIAAAEFKARCLELMDRVRETGVEYVALFEVLSFKFEP